MPRRPRICPAGTCFHVLNRAAARLTLFEKEDDYASFERVLELAHERFELPIFAYLVMPNHIGILSFNRKPTRKSRSFSAG
jgi:putative transposase